MQSCNRISYIHPIALAESIIVECFQPMFYRKFMMTICPLQELIIGSAKRQAAIEIKIDDFQSVVTLMENLIFQNTEQ